MIELNAEFWVAAAFAAFLAVLAYFGAHKMLLRLIDQRRDLIEAELEEAMRLKIEAKALLVQYQRKQREAEQAARAILAGAHAEVERMMAEAKSRTEEFVARRTRMAEGKITEAEGQALADVRAAAAEAAVAAAGKILAETVKDGVAYHLIDKGIEEIKRTLS
jgi:F-type H+-transporting ATPase subunit b